MLQPGGGAPLRPQVGQTPKKPPGFCQAAPAFDCTVRSVQPHCPFGLKFWFACTETQCVPGARETELRLITKSGPPVKLCASREATSVLGRFVPEFV
jgi:hypothetical protein